ncbi:MAG: extracellular solute-binding protein [Phycisphaerales bacterium]
MDVTAHMTRRAALAAVGVGAAGFVVFGPRGGGEVPRGRLVLDYWEKWTGLEGEAMRGIVDDFNRSQDRLFVRYLVTSTIHEKAMIAIAGGSPPDVVGLNSYNVPTYAQAGAVVALDELAPAHGLALTDYAAGMRQVMTHGGVGERQRWWATINTGGTLALYWNRGVFAERAGELRKGGVDPTRAPATIEEMERAQSALEVAGPDGSLLRTGHLHMEPGWWSWIWGYHFGGGLYDPAADRVLFDSGPTREAYAWVQRTTGDTARAKVINTLRDGFGPYGTARSAFLTGEVAMVVQGPWMANQIKAFRPDLDYGVAPVPVSAGILEPERPVALIDTDVLMIPAGARHPEASMAFIAFTQRQENVERLALAHCKGSPMVKVSEAFFAAHTNRGVRLHTDLAASPRAFVAPATPSWVEIKPLIDAGMISIWKHEAPAAKKLAELQGTSSAILARAAAMRARRREEGA